MTETCTNVTTSVERLTGRVKWFNNKAGYGFITITDGNRSGTDVFVHHSSVIVSNQQYKYLVQGEYVEFALSASQGGAHEFQATEVSGIKNGLLMCETRREFKMTRTSSKPSLELEGEKEFKPRSVTVRGSGPREFKESEKENWTLIGKNHQPQQDSIVEKESVAAPTSVKPRGRGRPPRVAK